MERNLTEEIDNKEVARISLCSEYPFKRMFSFLAGVSLSEYIRNGRLTLAAFDLMKRNLRVIDVAVKYGDRSADSFVRAFQKLHGFYPSEVQVKEQTLKAFPQMTFQLIIQGQERCDIQ
jgi:AraC family transcriptional regulator